LSALVATVISVGILVGLGVWQIERLHWKERVLAQIDAAESASPVELLPGQTPQLFAKVIAHGDLRGGRVALYGAEVRDDRMGAQLVEVLDRVGQKPLLVVLGWVPTDRGITTPVVGPRDVTGYVRLPETPNFLSASDDVEGLHFYTLNAATIGAALGAPGVETFVLVALRTPQGLAPARDAPVPAESLPRPPNNHLQYALTWFGLAGALIGVFAVWAFRRPPPV
jgi:surfeit locus 1 family protein